MAGNHSTRIRRGYRVDQASRLRALVEGSRTNTFTVAITSGKGGVGKSNTAVNLSICLAAKGVRAVLVDLDMGLANADLLMNLPVTHTLADVLAGTHTLDDVCQVGPGGFRFVPGASGIEELANLSEFDRQGVISQLHELETSADIVILDCGAGISRNVVGFALAADQAMVVTTPEPTALTDAYATIKTLHAQGFTGKVTAFINMAQSRAEARATYERLSRVAGNFLNYSVAYAGYMLHDTVVEQAVRQRMPFVMRHPDSNASACIAAVADDLVKQCRGQREGGGFFRRVVGLFV